MDARRSRDGPSRPSLPFGIAFAAVSGLLGFTEGREIAFGASALFGVAALGSGLDVRSVPER